MPNSADHVLSNRILRVEAAAPLRRNRAATRPPSHVAIFARGDCLGVSSLDEDELSPSAATYGDLVGRERCVDVSEKTSVEELGRMFEDTEIEALVVRSEAGHFVGAVTRQSLLDGLLQERTPAEEPPATVGTVTTAQSEALLAGERQFLECLLTADSPDGGLTELIEVIESLSDGMICAILLMDENGTCLRSGASINLPDEFVRAVDGLVIGPSAGCCGTAAFLKQAVIVSDIASDPLWEGFRDLALKHELRSCWSVPILTAGGNVLGTFAMYYREPRSPDAYHERLIERAVHLAAIAIESRHAETALVQSELRFRAMFESAPECVKLLDAEGNLLDMNAAGLRLIEADAIDQVRGESVFQLVAPAYQHEFKENLRAVFAGESNSQEFELIGLQGTRRWMETHQVPLRDEQGRVTSLLATTRDMTERKRSDDLLKALVEGTAGATGTDFFASFATAMARVFDSRYIVVCEHLDSPVSRTRTLAFWMHDKLGKNVEYDLAGGPCEATAQGEMTFYPSGLQELFPKDKDLVEMNAESYCGIPLTDSSGRVIGHLAILDDRPMDQNLRDIPALPVFVARAAAELERLRVERSLRESEQRLKAVISDLPVVITTIDQTGEVELFDGRALEALGFFPGQFVGRNFFDLWRERPELTNSMHTCLLGDVPAPTTIDVADRRMETRYSPVRNSRNEVTGAITVCVDVTERVQAENELRANHNLLNSILEGTSDPVFVKDEEGRYLMVNSACARVYGRTAEEIFGQDDFEILPDDVARKLQAADSAVRESGQTMTIEEVVPSDSQGMLRTYITTKAPYYNHEGRIAGIIGIAHDITERKSAEEALRDSEARSRTMLDGSPVCTKIIDLESRLQYMSRAGQELLKIADIETLYGSPFPPDLYPEAWRAPVSERVERAKRGEITNLECPVDDTEGNEIWFDTTFLPARNDDGRIEHVIATSVNVTERRQAEDDARRHRNELAHVSRVSTMGEMATGIAHELNQPLAAIAAYSETAKLISQKYHPESEDLPDILGKLKDQAIRAGKIVQRLRSYVKKSEPVRMWVDLHTLVRNVARFVDPDIGQAGVTLRLELDEPSSEILIDEIQMQQVLVNLIRNAIDAMHETPPEQRVLTITVRAGDDGQIEVIVCDAGGGLPREFMSHVFDAFYSTKEKGMGMGLPISRSIVESHGGKLWGRSNEGAGMSFGFSIPRNNAD